MKKTIIIILLLGFSFIPVNAQEVSKQLQEAHSAYNSGNLQEARFALQQAMNEIDMAIGAEIMKLLPSAMADIPLSESEDNIATAGFMGIIVNRHYNAQDTDKTASIEIISDSPMLTGVNALLSLPVFMGDSNQKRIRVGSKKALLQKNENESGVVSWDVQVPMGSTLLSFSCSGIDDEKTVTELVNTIPVDDISRLTR